MLFQNSDQSKNKSIENFLNTNDDESNFKFNPEEKLWMLRVYALLILKEDFNDDFDSFKEMLKILQFGKFVHKKDLFFVLMKLDTDENYCFDTFREYIT